MANEAQVLIGGEWRPARKTGGQMAFRAVNPQTGAAVEPEFPISGWADADDALAAAAKIAADPEACPGGRIADFLVDYAASIELHAQTLCALANCETALPIQPRLAAVELPRTVGQLRQAAAAARQGSWRRVVIDTVNNIRSQLSPVGPVCIFGPNNFPLAFNAVSGGDFAAAIAAGNPVIAKAHPLHPATSRALAELAHASVLRVGLPRAMVQMLYAVSETDGMRLVADPRISASAFTGSRKAGLQLKAAADAAGKPIYLEMSSINPVVVLPGALAARRADIVREFIGSVLLGTGQFCTNPGLVLLVKQPDSDAFIGEAAAAMASLPADTLFSAAVRHNLAAAVQELISGGARLVTGGKTVGGPRIAFENTLLALTGKQFLAAPELFQKEAFGNAAMCVQAQDLAELKEICRNLVGNLTGTIYLDEAADGRACEEITAILRPRVGRLLNNKMPTGVAVSPAMNHGGPFPATGHAHFTAVGLPAAIDRFTRLECYDQVPQNRLPPTLRDAAPGQWQCVDGRWRQAGPATADE